MEKNRSVLKVLFRDGARPNGNDFSDFIDSFIHRSEDGFSFTGGQTTINNLTLGGFAGAPQDGSMRFNGTAVQYYLGGTWKSIGADSQVFTGLAAQPAAIQPDVAYRGKVGVNIGATPAALTDDLEVGLLGATSKLRVATAVIGNNANGTSTRAFFFHNSVRNPAGPNTGIVDKNFAIAQDSNGTVSINSITGQPINFCIDGSPFGQMKNGKMLLGTTSELVPSSPIGAGETITLHVVGHGIKSSGGGSWLFTSDARAKRDISDFIDGLEKIKALKTVNYTYNGKGGTRDGEEQIGVIGQEVEKIMPYMIKRLGNEENEIYPQDMIVMDTSPLLFVMVNAIQELDRKIETLTQLKSI
ncbi:tail fiber domain-containing protein [Chitinophaga silvatica]|uniref:Tail fiber domain-containing protein n=1 Tax=Chitinophaga silvatica TaxID=2282649 RepID=A0A3E1Y3S1_9BACT|nr:tail fiber domain-containing protein [Chitinophaga silvatica]RFS19331.1 tail fiber domain-containing protein [Chitinophaga silvatica]